MPCHQNLNAFITVMAFMSAAMAPSALANVVGGDLQNFNTVPGGIDYVTVHSSETLHPGFFNFSIMGNHAVNSLPHFADESNQNRLRTGDTLSMVDFGLGVGVWKNLEVGASGQYLGRQTVNKGEERGQFSSTGVIGSRIYSKVRVFGDETHGFAVVGSGVFNRVRNNPYIGKGGSDIGIAELVADTKIAGINMALNMGYRFRKKGDPIPGYLIQPVGNQYIASCAMSYLLPFIDTKLIVEAFGSRPAEKLATGLTARQRSSAELLGGIKHDLSDNLALHAGMGTEMIKGASSPDWRIYAGLNWATETKPPPAPTPVSSVGQPLPPPPTLQTVAPREERATLRNLSFATGSDEIPPEGVAVLAALAHEINASAFDKIVIEGHTDSVGKAEYNLDLSNRRARAVRQWLIGNANIPAQKIEASGYGESRPIADNGNLQGRSLNRRVEVRVIRSGEPSGTDKPSSNTPTSSQTPGTNTGTSTASPATEAPPPPAETK